MAIDYSFLMKKLEKNEFIYVLFSGTTRLPFIECDEDTMDDCVYLFADEEECKNYAKRYIESKTQLMPGKIPSTQMKNFLGGLYCLGVNAVIIREEGAPIHSQLSELVPEPDVDKLKNDVIPKMNPELQLTSLYFLQELRRPVERSNAEKKKLRSLEEEMAVNMVRSRFIVAVDITDVDEKASPEEQQKATRIPMLKTKQGDTFQPCYTDFGEFQRFNAETKDRKLKLAAVSYDDLPKYLIPQSKGFAFNPAGFNLLLTREQMEKMKRYIQ